MPLPKCAAASALCPCTGDNPSAGAPAPSGVGRVRVTAPQTRGLALRGPGVTLARGDHALK